MITTHKIVFGNSNNMDDIPNSSVTLSTSLPYPMIEMWDETFCQQNPAIGEALKTDKGKKVF